MELILTLYQIFQHQSKRKGVVTPFLFFKNYNLQVSGCRTN
jgi:hypothetical protein